MEKKINLNLYIFNFPKTEKFKFNQIINEVNFIKNVNLLSEIKHLSSLINQLI